MMGLDARLDWMFYGSLQVSMNDGSGAIAYPPLTLGNRSSFKIELFAQSKTSNNGSIKIAPYIVLYGFEKSNTADVATSAVDQQTFFEPASRSLMVGITLSHQFF
jgi:hypothetical protein